MKLHEAIIHVLQQNGRPMGTREIANEINRQVLYVRQDILAKQICQRIHADSYEHLFTNTIGLSEWNI